MNRFIKFLGSGLVMLSVVAVSGPTRSATVAIEAMNPRGEIPPPPFHAPVPRVGNLDGKKVGIYWIGKAGGDNFWEGVEQLLNKRYPNAKTVRYEGPFDLGEARAAELAREVDTMFYGVGD